ncbi:DUF742 domain-containing protein [Kutzneria sp. 744]|uniref:DUF742 domain-containing protein n=1 Tax=Kutzneria sp. (strain 744) TaxID=345341 RepID=UPI0003EED38A|nr:DUF742 domain-containing protein [Kutzneria sp. 744]EWM19821.1 hypothetical protein KUTG_10125 [Kutzneria sp. 744]
MAGQEARWYDAEAGPLVRPFTMTGGRTTPATPMLDITTQVVTVPAVGERINLTPEGQAIVEWCHHALPVAELAAHLDVPLTVVKVVISDLIERGYVVVRNPTKTALQDPGADLLKRVLKGVRAL